MGTATVAGWVIWSWFNRKGEERKAVGKRGRTLVISLTKIELTKRSTVTKTRMKRSVGTGLTQWAGVDCFPWTDSLRERRAAEEDQISEESETSSFQLLLVPPPPQS